MTSPETNYVRGSTPTLSEARFRYPAAKTHFCPSSRRVWKEISAHLFDDFQTDAEGMRDIIDTDKTTFSARPAVEQEIIIKNWK